MVKVGVLTGIFKAIEENTTSARILVAKPTLLGRYGDNTVKVSQFGDFPQDTVDGYQDIRTKTCDNWLRDATGKEILGKRSADDVANDLGIEDGYAFGLLGLKPPISGKMIKIIRKLDEGKEFMYPEERDVWFQKDNWSNINCLFKDEKCLCDGVIKIRIEKLGGPLLKELLKKKDKLSGPQAELDLFNGGSETKKQASLEKKQDSDSKKKQAHKRSTTQAHARDSFSTRDGSSDDENQKMRVEFSKAAEKALEASGVTDDVLSAATIVETNLKSAVDMAGVTGPLLSAFTVALDQVIETLTQILKPETAAEILRDTYNAWEAKTSGWTANITAAEQAFQPSWENFTASYTSYNTSLVDLQNKTEIYQGIDDATTTLIGELEKLWKQYTEKYPNSQRPSKASKNPRPKPSTKHIHLNGGGVDVMNPIRASLEEHIGDPNFPYEKVNKAFSWTPYLEMDSSNVDVALLARSIQRIRAPNTQTGGSLYTSESANKALSFIKPVEISNANGEVVVKLDKPIHTEAPRDSLIMRDLKDLVNIHVPRDMLSDFTAVLQLGALPEDASSVTSEASKELARRMSEHIVSYNSLMVLETLTNFLELNETEFPYRARELYYCTRYPALPPDACDLVHNLFDMTGIDEGAWVSTDPQGAIQGADAYVRAVNYEVHKNRHDNEAYYAVAVGASGLFPSGVAAYNASLDASFQNLTGAGAAGAAGHSASFLVGILSLVHPVTMKLGFGIAQVIPGANQVTQMMGLLATFLRLGKQFVGPGAGQKAWQETLVLLKYLTGGGSPGQDDLMDLSEGRHGLHRWADVDELVGEGAVSHMDAGQRANYEAKLLRERSRRKLKDVAANGVYRATHMLLLITQLLQVASMTPADGKFYVILSNLANLMAQISRGSLAGGVLASTAALAGSVGFQFDTNSPSFWFDEAPEMLDYKTPPTATGLIPWKIVAWNRALGLALAKNHDLLEYGHLCQNHHQKFWEYALEVCTRLVTTEDQRDTPKMRHYELNGFPNPHKLDYTGKSSVIRWELMKKIRCMVPEMMSKWLDEIRGNVNRKRYATELEKSEIKEWLLFWVGIAREKRIYLSTEKQENISLSGESGHKEASTVPKSSLPVELFRWFPLIVGKGMQVGSVILSNGIFSQNFGDAMVSFLSEPDKTIRKLYPLLVQHINALRLHLKAAAWYYKWGKYNFSVKKTRDQNAITDPSAGEGDLGDNIYGIDFEISRVDALWWNDAVRKRFGDARKELFFPEKIQVSDWKEALAGEYSSKNLVSHHMLELLNTIDYIDETSIFESGSKWYIVTTADAPAPGLGTFKEVVDNILLVSLFAQMLCANASKFQQELIPISPSTDPEAGQYPQESRNDQGVIKNHLYGKIQKLHNKVHLTWEARNEISEFLSMVRTQNLTQGVIMSCLMGYKPLQTQDGKELFDEYPKWRKYEEAMASLRYGNVEGGTKHKPQQDITKPDEVHPYNSMFEDSDTYWAGIAKITQALHDLEKDDTFGHVIEHTRKLSWVLAMCQLSGCFDSDRTLYNWATQLRHNKQELRDFVIPLGQTVKPTYNELKKGIVPRH